MLAWPRRRSCPCLARSTDPHTEGAWGSQAYRSQIDVTEVFRRESPGRGAAGASLIGTVGATILTSVADLSPDTSKEAVGAKQFIQPERAHSAEYRPRSTTELTRVRQVPASRKTANLSLLALEHQKQCLDHAPERERRALC